MTVRPLPERRVLAPKNIVQQRREGGGSGGGRGAGEGQAMGKGHKQKESKKLVQGGVEGGRNQGLTPSSCATFYSHVP